MKKASDQDILQLWGKYKYGSHAIKMEPNNPCVLIFTYRVIHSLVEQG